MIGSPRRIPVNWNSQECFTEGQNCSALEWTTHGVLVRNPMHAIRDNPAKLYPYDLIVQPSGIVVEIQRVVSYICDECGESFESTQGLGGHKHYAHRRTNGTATQTPPDPGQ